MDDDSTEVQQSPAAFGDAHFRAVQRFSAEFFQNFTFNETDKRTQLRFGVGSCDHDEIRNA